nr:hypothetical protein [Plantactinospora sp. KBS50]
MLTPQAGRGWRDAMATALYGTDGFFVAGPGPAAHFRTSAQAPAFAAALGVLLARVDAALGHPDPLDVVDVGAGRGELLRAIAPTATTTAVGAPLPLWGAPAPRRFR